MEQATQLEDIRPQIDTPLRVKGASNLPSRNKKVSRDEFIRTNAFSPYAHSQIKSLLAIAPKYWKQIDEPTMQRDGANNTAIRDQTMLAFSSKRAGKLEVEAGAYLALAYIYDNMGNLKKGIENYKLYLEISKKMNNVIGQVLAYNCIGVNYMLLASPPTDAGVSGSIIDEQVLNSKVIEDDSNNDSSSSSSSARKDKFLKEAIIAHSEQLTVSDSGGIFVAQTNLGLCYAMAGDTAAAAKHHQDALRTSIKMQSIYGQSIAVGNLGLLAMLKGDVTTARTCFEQHVQLIQALQDPEAETNAWRMLAKLSLQEENHMGAIEALHQAREIASKNKLTSELRRIHCLIGECDGAMKFQGLTQNLANQAGVSLEY